MNPSAHCLVKKLPNYPWKCIYSGIRAQGYDLNRGTLPTDLLVTWTPWNNSIGHRAGEHQKSSGKDWIVFENGYLNASNGTRYYCAGLNGFNGHGDHRLYTIDNSRFDDLKIDIKDWSKNDGYILIVSQFGHRDTRYSMPVDWPNIIIEKIRKVTDRPILYRPKPGKLRIPTKLYKNTTIASVDDPIDELIKGAHITVIWNSKAAIESLIAGVPVVVNAPIGISKPMGTEVSNIESPYYPENRLEFFRELACSQWNEDEIYAGRPFRHLLR